MKGSDEVIKEFNDLVNMTAPELEKWLKSDDANSAGWPKDDEGDGESVGHDSGRRITEILKKNPDKDPEKYTDDQVDHMRKVVSYCKRHLAQEEQANAKKSDEEVKKTKSYASLKNWGHDPLKSRNSKKQGGGDEAEEKGDDDEQEAEEEEDGKQAGDKRKKGDSQSGTNKSRKTRQNGKKADDEDNEKDEEDGQEEDEEDEDDRDDGGDDEKKENQNKKKSNGNAKKDTSKENGSSGDQPKKGPKPGDTVSWNWGNGQPEGKVLDVKEEKTSIKTKRGNEVSRDGDPEDPAVVLDTGKSKAIKSNHELN